MRTPCCHSFLASILKFLNFFQTFIGLSMVLYSAYMLNQWNKHPAHHHPSPANYPNALSTNSILAANAITGHFDDRPGLSNDFQLPAPWFIYAFMSMGVVLCCITCIGHIAAEAINGCCLCFYTLLSTVLIILEAALVAFIALDRHWEKDLPFDPTGELDNFRSFVEDNVDIFEWVGIAVLVIQVLSLLIAIILRAVVSAQRVDHDIEEGDYDDRRGKMPLYPQLRQTSGSVNGDSKGVTPDPWSLRIQEKYGLNGGDATHPFLNQNTSGNSKP